MNKVLSRADRAIALDLSSQMIDGAQAGAAARVRWLAEGGIARRMNSVFW
jgi:hypothetical protein